MLYSPPSSLIFWLKADVEVYGPDGVTLAGDTDPVSLWKNQASTGSSYNVLQATSGNRPVYRAAIVNSLPAVHFARDESLFLETSGSVAHGIGTGNFLLISVCHTLSFLESASTPLFSIGAYSPAFYLDDSNHHPRFYLSSGTSFTDLTIATSTNYIIEYGRTGTTINAWFSEVGTRPSISSVSDTSNSTSIATDVFYVGWDTESTIYLSGMICELMLFNGDWTSGNKSDAEDYLNEKYAGTIPPATVSSGSAMLDF